MSADSYDHGADSVKKTVEEYEIERRENQKELKRKEVEIIKLKEFVKELRSEIKSYKDREELEEKIKRGDEPLDDSDDISKLKTTIRILQKRDQNYRDKMKMRNKEVMELRVLINEYVRKEEEELMRIEIERKEQERLELERQKLEKEKQMEEERVMEESGETKDENEEESRKEKEDLENTHKDNPPEPTILKPVEKESNSTNLKTTEEEDDDNKLENKEEGKENITKDEYDLQPEERYTLIVPWLELVNNEKYQFVEPKEDGYGEYEFENGDVYKGNWKDGKMCGKGVLYFNHDGSFYQNGARWEGNFENNMLNDKEGVLYYSSLTEEEKEKVPVELERLFQYSKGNIENKEEEKFSKTEEEEQEFQRRLEERLDENNRKRRSGEWVDNKRNGVIKGFRRISGLFYTEIVVEEDIAKSYITFVDEDKENKTYYKGGMMEGKKEGENDCYLVNIGYGERYNSDNFGWVYFGEHECGERHGKGKISLVNGGYIEGEFRNGKLHGKAISYRKNGTVTYDGFYKYGDRDGQGKLYLIPDAEVDKEEHSTYLYYEGSFKRGLTHGDGVKYYEDGSIRVKGRFENGEVVHGEFITQPASKDRSPWINCGPFKDGRLEGKCKIYWLRNRPDDRVLRFEGDYKQGQNHGICTTYCGLNYHAWMHGDYKMGKKHGLYRILDQTHEDWKKSGVRSFDVYFEDYRLAGNGGPKITARYTLRKAKKKHKNDAMFVKSIVRENWREYEFIGDDLKKDKDLFLFALGLDHGVLEFADPSFRSDREIVKGVLEVDGSFIKHVDDPKLLEDEDIVLTVIKSGGSSLQYLEEAVQVKYSEHVMDILEREPETVYFSKLKFTAENEERLKRVYMKALSEHPSLLRVIVRIFLAETEPESEFSAHKKDLADAALESLEKKVHSGKETNIEGILDFFCSLIWLVVDTKMNYTIERKRKKGYFEDILSKPMTKGDLKKLREEVWTWMRGVSDCFKFSDFRKDLLEEAARLTFDIHSIGNDCLFLGFLVNIKKPPICVLARDSFRFSGETKGDEESVSLMMLKKGKQRKVLMNGFGIVFQSTGNLLLGDTKYQRIFCGGFGKGKKLGKGTVYNQGGFVIFEGKFLNDVKEGNGIEYKTFGKEKYPVQVFEGMFVNDRRHGRGESYDPKTGRNINGFWEDGKLDEDNILSYEFPLIDYSKVEKVLKDSNLIGQGAFGRVYKVRSNKIPSLKVKEKFLAVKVMFSRNSHEAEIISRVIRRGAKLCSRVNEKHILKIYAIFRSKTNIGYIMPICKLSVDKIIFSSDHTQPMDEKIRFLYETAKGMCSLHERNIMHRDLKWGNVLVSYDNVIQITDFDTLREDERAWRVHTQAFSSRVGTPGYMAPEVFLGSKYGLSCDVYSFGIMIYSLLFELNNPYISQYQCSCGVLIDKILSSSSLNFHVSKCKLRPLVDPKVVSTFPPFLIDLMTQCYSHNPIQRPSFSEMVDLFESKQVSQTNYSIFQFSFEMYHEELYHEYDLKQLRMLVVKPSFQYIVNWLENRFVTSQVEELFHKSLGEIRNDEDVLRLIKFDQQPIIEVRMDDLTEYVRKKKIEDREIGLIIDGGRAALNPNTAADSQKMMSSLRKKVRELEDKVRVLSFKNLQQKRKLLDSERKSNMFHRKEEEEEEEEEGEDEDLVL